jgi:putative transposase
MVSPTVKREAVAHLVSGLQLAPTRACRVVGLATSTFHHTSKRIRSDEPVRSRLKELAGEKTKWGCPMLFNILRREGFKDNYKRVERIYRSASLQISRRPKKKLRSKIRVSLPVPIGPNETWSMDFVHDSLSNDRRFRCFNLIDDFTRECLVIHVARSIRSKNLVEILEDLKKTRPLPKNIRCDNGPELISIAMDFWAYRNNVKISTIDPGKPTQNAIVESFNGKFRAECLNQNWFENLEQAKEQIEIWRHEYNTMRPHSSIGMKTPNEYAAEFLTRHAA